MSRNSVTLYKTLNKELYESMCFSQNNPVVYYRNGNDTNLLSLELKDSNGRTNIARLTDDACKWMPDDYGFNIGTDCVIGNPAVLFGTGGIADDSAEIGVAVIWTDAKAKQRGSFEIGSFRKQHDPVMLAAEYRFAEGILRGELHLSTVLYLKRPGERTKNSPFAAETGMLLGCLSEWTIVIEGSGSTFPIVVYNSPGNLLWTVRYNSACDPMTDAFDEENVCIFLNSAHPLYPLLNIEKSMADSPLLVEALTSALLLICSCAKSAIGADWDSLMSNGEEIEDGTIAQAMFYFCSKLGWNFSSEVELSESIRQFFEKKVLGGKL